MKERGLFRLIPLFLAIFLAICACESSPPEPPSDSKNGVLYYAPGNSGEWVIVGIADPAEIEDSRAAAPKNGYWYVIGIGSETNAGEEPVSMGTIQVVGTRLTFTPFTDMGFPASTPFTGTLSNGSLVLDSIPGRSYNGITLEEGPDYDFKSSDDPWGTGGGLPRVPGGPNFGGGGGTPPPPSASPLFNPGKFVTDVIIIEDPTVKTAYEGFPVDLTGIKVEIRYSNGDKVTKTSANAKEFLVEPPVYTYPNGQHIIKYIAEYNDPFSSDYMRSFTAPQTDQSLGTSFYPLLNPDYVLEATGTSNKEYYEGYNTFDFSGISIKATYSNGPKTITPTSVYQTQFYSAQAPDDSKLEIKVGTKYAVVPIKFINVHYLRDIQLEGTPNFSAQVLYDDPRFFSVDSDKHWLTKFNNVNIKFLYKGTSTTKSVKITEAIGKRNNEGLVVFHPENLVDKNPELTFVYYSYTYEGAIKEFKTTYVVPVYNKLTGITVESTAGKIVLRGSGPLPEDNEQSFLSQVKISAFYQMGSDKNKTVKRDNILIYPSETYYYNYIDIDYDLINALPLITNIKKYDDGILTLANSTAYDKKNKLVKAKVTFRTASAGGPYEPTEKSATIEVGVTGY